MHIDKNFFHIKTFKIAPCFDPKIIFQGATLFLAKVTFLKMRSLIEFIFSNFCLVFL